MQDEPSAVPHGGHIRNDNKLEKGTTMRNINVITSNDIMLDLYEEGKGPFLMSALAEQQELEETIARLDELKRAYEDFQENYDFAWEEEVDPYGDGYEYEDYCFRRDMEALERKIERLSTL